MDVQELNINNSTYDIKAKSVVDTNSGKLKFWSGTQAQYDAITTKDPTTLYNVTDTDPSYSVNTQYKNIGAIVQSVVPLTDAGLHLLDGSLIQMGVYSEFVEYMANLYGDGTNIPNYFCTESEWQTAVTTYGVCGKFVYDSVANSVRLPKITGIIEGTTDVTALGDLVEAGLPNIIGDAPMGAGTNYGLINSDATAPTGAFKRGTPSAGGCYNAGGTGGASSWALGFDASLSSTIYGNSNTVQPQTIKAFYYIVIATITKTDIQVDIDAIVTDLNGKADVDLTNVNNAGTSRGASWAMPSDTYINLTPGASGVTYTAPANGWFAVSSSNGNLWARNYANNLSFNSALVSGFSGGSLFIPCIKNSNVMIAYDGAIDSFRFIYAQGSESEAS